MKTTVKLDDVLDLVVAHQEELAATIDTYLKSTTAYAALWKEYKQISKLYDDIRRIANND